MFNKMLYLSFEILLILSRPIARFSLTQAFWPVENI